MTLLWWQAAVGSFRLGFTSRSAGNLAHHVGERGDAEANRRKLETELGVNVGAFRYLNQVHSADVVDAQLSQSGPTGDAWISSDGTHALAVMAADCLPVLFHSTREDGTELSAAAHAGRPGLIRGVLQNAVAALRERGGRRITAWIGPAACGDCYEVPEEMFDQLTMGRPALAATTSWGTPSLDLRAEARAVLESLEARVVDVAGCTIEDHTLFSHRRSQRTGEPEGRIAGLIWSGH